MKPLIFLLLILISLSACYKEAQVTPQISTASSKPSVAIDTIPDSAMLKIKLVADSINTDETMFVFNHRSSLAYVFNEDAAYFQGFGQVSLASISSDGRDLAINGLPSAPGMSIDLDVHTKTSGNYFMGISYQDKMPPNIQIMLKDTYLKDSVDLCTRNYNFKVDKIDTNSFGKKRFKIILRVNPN